MRFWDSSAIIPLCLSQPASPAAQALLREDPAMVAWWGSPVECWSAFARLRREGVLDETAVQAATERLDALRQAWVEVLPTEQVRTHAARLLRTHPLRAADALQLAAALVWAGTPPQGTSLVTFDRRLAQAARSEGFQVLEMACAPASDRHDFQSEATGSPAQVGENAGSESANSSADTQQRCRPRHSPPGT